MGAAEDYPWPVGDVQHAIKQHGIMCREIDRLRAAQADAAQVVADAWAIEREAIRKAGG